MKRLLFLLLVIQTLSAGAPLLSNGCDSVSVSPLQFSLTDNDSYFDLDFLYFYPGFISYPVYGFQFDDTTYVKSSYWRVEGHVSIVDGDTLERHPRIDIQYTSLAIPANYTVTGTFGTGPSINCRFPLTFVFNSTTGITNNASGNLGQAASVFPNPSSNKLNIQLYANEQTELTLYNSLGGVIIINTLTDKNNEIDITGLSTGIYFYRLTSGNNITKTGKVIKQ